MSQGPHVHEWKYNEVEEWQTNYNLALMVIRFCVKCLEAERVELKRIKEKQSNVTTRT